VLQKSHEALQQHIDKYESIYATLPKQWILSYFIIFISTMTNCIKITEVHRIYYLLWTLN